jgi:hypothetical protein
VFVVGLAGLQAVVQLAEEFVEQVSLGLVVPVSGGAAGIIVAAGAGRAAQGGQRPDRTDGGKTPVFDMAVQHHGFLAAGAGDRGGSGEGFQPAGIGKPAAVIADLGQHPGTGQVPESGKTGDDRGVRVLLKMGDRRLGQLVNGQAGGLELAQQCGELNPHGVFDQWQLVQVSVGEDCAQPPDVTIQIAGGPQPLARQLFRHRDKFRYSPLKLRLVCLRLLPWRTQRTKSWP